MDDACVAVVSVRLVLYSAFKISDYFVEFTGFENELEFWRAPKYLNKHESRTKLYSFF